MPKLNTILFLFLSVSLFVSCNPSRRLPEGAYLLQNNAIEISDTRVSKSDLKGFVRQRPNRKILGLFRFHLNVYQLADRGKETRFKNWTKNTIGEPPVIYDRSLAESTINQFELYLHSKGYFNADLELEENLKKKKAKIRYQVVGNAPYIIHQKNYLISDDRVHRFVLNDSLQSLIKVGQRYDAEKLEDERNRITRYLRNNGFFRFSRDFIIFRVDSNLNKHAVNIDVIINDPPQENTADSLRNARHRRFLLDKVIVLPEFSAMQTDVVREDTTIFIPDRPNINYNRKYTFLHNGPLRIKPFVIVNHLRLRPDEYFRISDVEQSYDFLTGLRNFRFINLQFQEAENPEHGNPTDSLGYLNAYVQLNRSAANAFTVEAEGLNTAGNLGVASNFLYQNRNIFRNAEIFNLRFKGALEVTGESSPDEVIQRLPFNTLELGVEAGIDFPRFLLPFTIERIARNARPKSTIVTGINFRQRPDYTRYILNFNYGFEWNQSSNDRHQLNPLEISSIRVFNDSILRANVPDANPFILSRFRNHFIVGLKHTYVLNTQDISRMNDFVYLRTNFESAGGLLNLLSEPLQMSVDETGSYNIFNIPFSQFLRGDADFRYYRVFDENESLVFRLMAGAGVPYGNVSVLPFIKSYYGGGANGIRAWRIYSLGPGSYASDDQTRFDRYGDIKIEANIEYRFQVYNFWHGAFFLDAGNVWFINQNDQFPGGEFRWDSFGRDIALGGGLGVRLDFDFFILRIDAAVPLKDPALPTKGQWISQWPGFRDYNLNLGIGYPF